MWSLRNNTIKDELIPRISAKNLTRKQFEDQFAKKNKPVIISDLKLWKDKEKRSILNINDINSQMNENYSLKNVFVSSNNHRFLYFDRSTDEEHEKNPQQIRKQMAWQEFISRAKIQKNRKNRNSTINEFDPLLTMDEEYYLYGEPIPPSLIPFIKAPHFLPITEQQKNTAKKEYICNKNDYKCAIQQILRKNRHLSTEILNTKISLNPCLSLDPIEVRFEECLDIDIIDSSSSPECSPNINNIIDDISLIPNPTSLQSIFQSPTDYKAAISESKLVQLTKKYQSLITEYAEFCSTQEKLLILTLQNMVKYSYINESVDEINAKQDIFITVIKQKVCVKLQKLKLNYVEFINDLIAIENLERKILRKKNGKRNERRMKDDDYKSVDGNCSKNGNNQRFEINSDNCMLWISLSETCSALHFDLCEGFLCQLSGMKKVVLFPMEANSLETLYAYPMESEHRRQSKISNIHMIDHLQHPLFKNVVGYQGIISRDEGLYIPIGFWHQIESDDEMGSISLSFRWNPYLKVMKQSILTSESKKTPEFLRECIFNQCIQALPMHVRQLSLIWKQCWKTKVNDMNKIEPREECDVKNDCTKATEIIDSAFVQKAYFFDVD